MNGNYYYYYFFFSSSVEPRTTVKAAAVAKPAAGAATRNNNQKSNRENMEVAELKLKVGCHYFHNQDPISWLCLPSAKNRRLALLTVSKESALAEAGNYVLTSIVLQG